MHLTMDRIGQVRRHGTKIDNGDHRDELIQICQGSGIKGVQIVYLSTTHSG